MRQYLENGKTSIVTGIIELCSVLCPRQHRIGYIGDGIYTVGHTKRETFIFSITQTNIDRFS